MGTRMVSRVSMGLGCLFFLAGCAQTPKFYESPIGYDLNKGEPFVLPDVLHELSGIAFPEKSGDLIYANEDENGKVYFFSPGNPTLREIQFGKAGDYEAIAIGNGHVVVLESKGTVYTFPFLEIGQNKVTGLKITENLIPGEEYESLAFSPADGLLYILCKKCRADKATASLTGYILDLSMEGTVSYKGEFQIDEGDIDRFAGLKGKRFRPSALTQNPRTKEWFILSSINKMLVTANEKWEITGAYPLDPSLFNQPEAIAFDHDGNLYIGNEGGDKARNATLLKFNLIH